MLTDFLDFFDGCHGFLKSEIQKKNDLLQYQYSL